MLRRVTPAQSKLGTEVSHKDDYWIAASPRLLRKVRKQLQNPTTGLGGSSSSLATTSRAQFVGELCAWNVLVSSTDGSLDDDPHNPVLGFWRRAVDYLDALLEAGDRDHLEEVLVHLPKLLYVPLVGQQLLLLRVRRDRLHQDLQQRPVVGG
eukprot:1180883-Prorocentrum_minimum.AAC.2